MTSFSRMCISVAVNGSSSSMESVLNVGLYFEKMGFYSQCHINTCFYGGLPPFYYRFRSKLFTNQKHF